MTQEMDLFAESEDVPEADPERPWCACGEALVAAVCPGCRKEICPACSYREEGGTLSYCRDCANERVGVCDVCDALHARACHECGLMVCEAHQTRIVERWGWGGVPGQGGVLEWFPIMRTYCQAHGQDRSHRPKPAARLGKRFDGSSPEW